MAESARAFATSARLDLRLQLGRQARLVWAVDALLVGLGLLDALVGLESTASGLYTMAVLMPLLVLGVPVLADTVALERRAGCLELALMSPRGDAYFLRRAGVISGLFAAQGVAVMLLDWAVTGGGFSLLPVLLQLLAVCALAGATALFWASRLASAGSVWLASLATLVGGGAWTLWVPVVAPLPGEPPRGAFLPAWVDVWELASHVVPVGAAAVLMLLYARRRLRVSERMLRGAG